MSDMPTEHETTVPRKQRGPIRAAAAWCFRPGLISRDLVQPLWGVGTMHAAIKNARVRAAEKQEAAADARKTSSFTEAVKIFGLTKTDLAFNRAHIAATAYVCLLLSLAVSYHWAAWRFEDTFTSAFMFLPRIPILGDAAFLMMAIVMLILGVRYLHQAAQIANSKLFSQWHFVSKPSMWLVSPVVAIRDLFPMTRATREQLISRYQKRAFIALPITVLTAHQVGALILAPDNPPAVWSVFLIMVFSVSSFWTFRSWRMAMQLFYKREILLLEWTFSPWFWVPLQSRKG